MRPTTKWWILSMLLIAGGLVGWHFGLGLWSASWTWYQFNLMMGQGIIVAGVAVLLWEIEKHWYDDEEDE